MSKELQTIRERFREKWGRFYYSDENGMDWEKPQKQNVTGGIPSDHTGFCIASDTIENDFETELKSLAEEVLRVVGDVIVGDGLCPQGACNGGMGCQHTAVTTKQKLVELFKEMGIKV